MAFLSIECPTCVVEPLLFIRGTVDGVLSLYCHSCGGVYTTPDAWDFTYGDVPLDLSEFRVAAWEHIRDSGLTGRALEAGEEILLGEFADDRSGGKV